MNIGKLNDEDISFKVGEVTGEKLKAFGFNMNFAPVLDIYSNPKNMVIGDRSFGVEPEAVKLHGVATMKGLSGQGIIPVVKHFPGHGDTVEDSHLKLPIVYHDYNRLDSFELLPFKYAIEEGSDAIMVAHILLPKLDSDYPASLSKYIITDLLRNKLNFHGVVITDDMEMNAIAKNYTVEDAALKSVEAGSDIILICKNYENSIKAIDKIKLAVANNEISEERINESVYRILELKSRYKVEDKNINEININFLNKKVENILGKSK
jgi:beta-N-acetylhexosaminidase